MTDIPSWAVRGAKVVFVGGEYDPALNAIHDPAGVLKYPERGEAYTIREVRVRFVTEVMELIVGVLLDEIENPIADGGSATGEEMGFDVRDFRPLKRAKAERDMELEVS